MNHYQAIGALKSASRTEAHQYPKADFLPLFVQKLEKLKNKS